MRLNLRLIGCLVLAVAGLAACNRTYDPTPEHVYRIFPTEDGKYRIYYVVDTVFETAQQQEFEEQIYYKQEFNDGKETDLLDREVTRLMIYRSPDTLGTPDNPVYDWTFQELWTLHHGEEYSERIEGNIRYLVLQNPAYPEATWDGNLFNNETQQTYRFANIDTTVEVQGTVYENCVYVLQQEFYQPIPDSSEFFISDHQYEIYAPDIGLIKRYYKRYRRQGGTVVADESRIFLEELVEHNYY